MVDPGPRRCSGRGQAADLDRHHLVDRVEWGRAVGSDPDRPPTRRTRPGHGHVTPQVDQHATSEGGGETAGGPIGGECLGRGAEVEMDTGGDGHGPVLPVQFDLPPSGGGHPHELAGDAVVDQVVEVPVVAELDES